MRKHYLSSSILRPLFLLSIIIFGSLPTTVSADTKNFYKNNDILYFDPSSAGCSTVGTSYSTNLDIPSLSGSENAEKIWNFLVDPAQGLSNEQAAGLMGNLYQESGFKPDLEEGPDSYAKHNVRPVGYGIVQWTGERRLALEAAAKKKGVPVSDLGFQLAYMIQEAQSPPLVNFKNLYTRFNASEKDNVWDVMKKQKTIEDALVFWHDGFERSGDTPEAVISVRGKYAKEAFEKYSGKSASTSSSAGGSACSAAGSGDLIATLLEYAHPEYHENNFAGPVPPPKPAYLEVATKLAKEGKWVGGGQLEIGIPGIDCGGFVSVLLTQSGFEPDYNFGLDGDRGSSNQEYGQLPWAKRHWKFLGSGGVINPSDLRPGDVAYSNGHTFVYVGQVNGFQSQYASASYSWWRAPMAGGSFETATSPEYVWYGRREGTPAAYGTTKMSDPIPNNNDVNPGTSVWTGGEDR